MLKSVFRLGTYNRIGINFFLSRSHPIHSGRRPVKILNDEEDEPSFESIADISRLGRKKSDFFRQRKFRKILNDEEGGPPFERIADKAPRERKIKGSDVIRQSEDDGQRISKNEDEGPPTERFTHKTRQRKKEKKADVFRQSIFDGHFYIKSQVNEETRKPDDLESDGHSRPPWITKEDDYELSKFMVTVKSRKQRRKKNITLLEGKRLISDALSAGVQLKALFTSQRTIIKSLPLPAHGYKLYWVPYKCIAKWSDVRTPSGVLAIVEIPPTNQTAPDPKSLPLTVVCDNIRDPGNMGAILRLLAAAGCSKVLITKGCVDIWEPKVLRAAAGGHFRVPIEYDLHWEDVNSILGEETCSVFLADSWDKSGHDVADTESFDSEEDRDGGSLDLHREDTQNSDLGEVKGCGSDGESLDLQRGDTQKIHNSVRNSREVLEALPYYNFKFNKAGKVVLIISNEYFGPSDEACAFTSERKGVKLNIPLCGNVESLNVVSALSVITFEMKRQMSSP